MKKKDKDMALVANATSELLNDAAGLAAGGDELAPSDWRRFKTTVARVRKFVTMVENGTLTLGPPPDGKAAPFDMYGHITKALPGFEALCAKRYDHEALVSTAKRFAAPYIHFLKPAQIPR